MKIDKKYYTRRPNLITRSQFKQPELLRKFGIVWSNRKELFNYLKHDYTEQNQLRIKKSIYQFVPKYSSLLYGLIGPYFKLMFTIYDLILALLLGIICEMLSMIMSLSWHIQSGTNSIPNQYHYVGQIGTR